MTKFHISCFSKGLYSNWFWHTPSRTLFDCGEGFATYAGNYVFGIERVCISHGVHGDHICGLINLIGARNSSRGDKEKPLDIYYPEDDNAINFDYKDFIAKRFGNWLTFKINWFPIRAGYKIILDKNHWIESFELKHTKRSTTLGYKIVENRTRLKPEFNPKDIPDILKRGIVKSADLNETYTANVLAYCLDAYDFNAADIVGSNLAIIDSSFLKSSDRDEPTHLTLEEALSICNEAKVANIALAHISSRYNPDSIKELTKDIPSNAFVINPFAVNHI